MSRLSVLLPVLAAAFFAAGCDRPAQTGADAAFTPPAILVRGNGGEPGTLDPALAEDVHAFNVLADLYEGLLVEAADGTLIPGVAESWSISDDGLRYEFRIRNDARWSNGDPVTASDFVRAFDRVTAPETQSAYAFLLAPLARSGAPDDATLVLELAEPASHFLSVLAMPVAFPMHPDAALPDSFAGPGKFVGNGPYLLTSRKPDGPIRLRRNPLYRDADSVSIEEVEYLPIVEDETEFNMYRAGQLHVTYSVPSTQVHRLRDELPDELRIAPKLAFYYLAFDLSQAPLDDVELRKALSLAIDREQIVALIGRGELPAYGIVPPGVTGHTGASYDWAELPAGQREVLARTALANAGFGPDQPLTVTLTYDAGDIHERIALAVGSMWEQVLGVDVEFVKLEWQLYLDTRARRDEWQVMRFNWFGDYNDPMTFLEIFDSGSPQNLPGYANDGYDRLLEQANRETRPAERGRLMTEAEQAFIADYSIAPLYFYVSKHLVKPFVAGYEDNALDRHPSKYLRFEKPARGEAK